MSKKFINNPQLTLNGSYEKGWKKMNNEWWLYKVGSKEEIFSELFYSTLFELLGLPTAHYEYDGENIKTKNFAINYDFESMTAVAGENESYDFIYKELSKINVNIANEYIRLCFFDVILNNFDRHNENCGLIRDKKTGEIISLAPNFDNNQSLISRSAKLDSSNDEGFLKHFTNAINKHKELKNGLRNINIPKINEDILDRCFQRIEIKVDNESKIKEFILNRYNYLLKVIDN